MIIMIMNKNKLCLGNDTLGKKLTFRNVTLGNINNFTVGRKIFAILLLYRKGDYLGKRFYTK